MKRTNTSGLIGLVLIVVGLLVLFQNFGFLESISSAIWSLLFVIGGIAFLAVFLRDSAQWWAAIPGCTLVGIGTLIGIDQLFPAMADTWDGSIFLGMIGLSFMLIYLTHTRFWWALIPGGALLTLAVVAATNWFIPDEADGSVFFLGLALTFGLLYLAPTPSGHMKWPLIPAATLLALSVVTMSSIAWTFNFIWPVVLMLVGLYLIYRTFQPGAPTATPDTPALPITRQQEERYEDQTLPQPH